MTPVNLPITSPSGALYVPDWLDAISPAIADARKRATAATEAARAARAAVPEARAALTALSTVTFPGPVYTPAPTATTAAFDRARMALATAEAKLADAELADRRARDAFHDIASKEAETPAVIEAVGAALIRADEAALTAWETALAALDAREELDHLAGVLTLSPDGVYAATTDGVPLLYRRRVDYAGYGIRYALKNVGDHFAAASVIAGGAE